MMQRRTFAVGLAATLFAAFGVGRARASYEDRVLERLYAMIAALVLKYYPDAKTDLTKRTIRFEAHVRRFMIHEQLKTGEWQDAHGMIGPQRGGVVGRSRRGATDVRQALFPALGDGAVFRSS